MGAKWDGWNTRVIVQIYGHGLSCGTLVKNHTSSTTDIQFVFISWQGRNLSYLGNIVSENTFHHSHSRPCAQQSSSSAPSNQPYRMSSRVESEIPKTSIYTIQIGAEVESIQKPVLYESFEEVVRRKPPASVSTSGHQQEVLFVIQNGQVFLYFSSRSQCTKLILQG